LESRSTFSATDNITRLQENGRTAVDLLTSSIRRAGYLGSNSDFDTVWGSQPPVAPAGTCVVDDATWVRMVGRGVFGLNDTRLGYDCVDAAYSAGDIITLRFASPWRVDTADMVSTRLYLRSSLFEGKIFLGSEEANPDNTVLDQPQQQHQMLAYTYYIADTGRTCNGSAIPALFREAPDANNRPVAEELVAGIENMQIQYNVGNQYVNADAVADWDDVTSVKLWVLVRSECPETGFTDDRTYVLGDIADYAPADGYRRYLYSTVVALRNRG
jgi:type IV pilus assembly protein PilW